MKRIKNIKQPKYGPRDLASGPRVSSGSPKVRPRKKGWGRPK